MQSELVVQSFPQELLRQLGTSRHTYIFLLREEEIAITMMMMRTARVELQIYVYAMFPVNGFPHH